MPGEASVQEYHSFALDDYVNVLAVTRDGTIPLVRQYRPALERPLLELPGGLPNSGENPSVTAGRELYEETGYRTTEQPILLGCLQPDSGRLENRLWCYMARKVEQDPSQRWHPEPGVELVMMSSAGLKKAIVEGEFVHALHIAIVGLAVIQGHLRFDT